MSENLYFRGGNYTLDTPDNRYVGRELGNEVPEVPTDIWKANTEYIIGDVVYSHANTEPKALAFKATATAIGTGTYVQQSGSTTVTITSPGHGLSTGNSVTFDFTSGDAVDGTFSIQKIDDDRFWYSAAQSNITTSGNVCFNVGTVTCPKSGSIEPVWPENLGETIVDNQITWTVVSTIYQKLLPSSVPAIVELFELELEHNVHTNDAPSTSPTYYDGTTGGYPTTPDARLTYRFHDGANANNNGDLYFNGRKYMRLPIQASGFEFKGGQNQTLPRPTLTVSNLFGLITSIIAEANTFNQATGTNDLLGAKVTRIKTLETFVDASNFGSDAPIASEDGTDQVVDSEGNSIVFENDPNPNIIPNFNIRFPDEIYFINRKTNEDRNSVEFELVAPFDLPDIQVPKEVCLPEQFPAVGTFK